MKIETKLSCGDKVWAFRNGHFYQYTIGQVNFKFVKSSGLEPGQYFHGQILVNDGDNCGPLPEELEESYMCVETGIGSGSVHTIGKTIFLTKEDCEEGSAEEIKRIAEAKAYREKQEREELLRREPETLRLLARIEAAKATA